MAAYYVNGFTWSQSEINRMSRVFGVSVMREAYWARNARCIDIEQGAGEPVDVVPFIEERRRYLHERYGQPYDDATVYVNRGNWEIVRSHVHAAGVTQPRYWVATLDGTQDVPEAWAVQYYGGPHSAYDLSVLLGKDDLHTP